MTTPHTPAPGAGHDESEHHFEELKPEFHDGGGDDLYAQFIKEQHDRGSSTMGAHSPLSFAIWTRDVYWANISDEVKREMAQSHVTTMEGVNRPRQMGMADRDYKLGRVLWFDEVLLYKNPHTGKINKWWEVLESSDDKFNKPPATPGHHLKEGVDYEIYTLPLQAKKLDDEIMHHYLEDVPTHSEKGVAYSEGQRNVIADRLARNDMWEMAANVYASYCAFRMNRGEVEKWASAFEPALLLDQKPDASGELLFVNDKERFVLTAETQKRKWERQLAAEIAKPNPSQAKIQDLKEKISDAENYLFQMKYTDDTEMRKVVGDDWKTKSVNSQFTTFHSVGRLLLQKLLPAVAVALARSRRFQARSGRIVGVEIGPSGTITPDSIVYGRLSEALEYQELLACAFLDRAGVEKLLWNGEPMLPEIQKRLDAYRRYHGLRIIKLDLNIDMRGKDPKDKKKEKIREHDVDGIDIESDDDDEGPAADEAKDIAEAKKAKAEAKKKAAAAATGAPEAPVQPTAAPVSGVQEDYYKMQTEQMYADHRKNYPPPDWKKSKLEWKLLEPREDIREQRWNVYFDRQGIVGGLDPKLKTKNKTKWENLWKKLGDNGEPTTEDLEDDDE